MKQLLIVILAFQLILLPRSTIARGRGAGSSAGSRGNNGNNGGDSSDGSSGDTYIQKAKDYVEDGEDQVETIVEAFGDLADALVNLKDAFDGPLEDALSSIKTRINNIKNQTKEFTSDYTDTLTQTIESIEDEIASIRQQLNETAIPLINKALSNLRAFLSTLNEDYENFLRKYLPNTADLIYGEDDSDDYTAASAQSIGVNGITYDVNNDPDGVITFKMQPSELYMLGFGVIAIMVLFNTVLSIIIGQYCCNPTKNNYGPVKYDSNTDA